VNQQIPSNLLKQGIKNCFKISAVTKSPTKIKIFSLSLELAIIFVQAPIARAVISKIHPIKFHM
jgi:hypothetical protein